MDLRALTGSNFRTTLLCLCYRAQQWSANILSSPPLPCSPLLPLQSLDITLGRDGLGAAETQHSTQIQFAYGLNHLDGISLTDHSIFELILISGECIECKLAFLDVWSFKKNSSHFSTEGELIHHPLCAM